VGEESVEDVFRNTRKANYIGRRVQIDSMCMCMNDALCIGYIPLCKVEKTLIQFETF
jgi:phosphoribosylaminoimidazole (AIR) synthetase